MFDKQPHHIISESITGQTSIVNYIFEIKRLWKKLQNEMEKRFFSNRFFGGVCDAASWGAILSILMTLYPGKEASVLAGTEMVSGLGFMIGKVHL